MPFCSRAVQLPRRFLPTTTVGGAGLHEGGSPSFMIIILLTANGMLLSRPPPNPYGSKSAAQDRWVATREYLPLVKTIVWYRRTANRDVVRFCLQATAIRLTVAPTLSRQRTHQVIGRASSATLGIDPPYWRRLLRLRFSNRCATR